MTNPAPSCRVDPMFLVLENKTIENHGRGFDFSQFIAAYTAAQ